LIVVAYVIDKEKLFVNRENIKTLFIAYNASSQLFEVYVWGNAFRFGSELP
jgi:hypothetical protein